MKIDDLKAAHMSGTSINNTKAAFFSKEEGRLKARNRDTGHSIFYRVSGTTKYGAQKYDAKSVKWDLKLKINDDDSGFLKSLLTTLEQDKLNKDDHLYSYFNVNDELKIKIGKDCPVDMDGETGFITDIGRDVDVTVDMVLSDKWVYNDLIGVSWNALHVYVGEIPQEEEKPKKKSKK